MPIEDVEQLVDELSLEEQVSLLSGEDFWSLPTIARLGIGKLRVTDGPNGARGSGSLLGDVKSAAFPVGIAIGASWNPELAKEIGAAIAEEVRSKAAHVSLAPTVNIQRSVTNGRNFECYSEDPELTAALAVGFVSGLQSKGVSATIKHFAGNESEFQRASISSEIDERSLREVYLRPFEDAVKIAGTWGIMSSYNRLNGTFTSENDWLLNHVLRGDWKFDGIVMSDWFGSHSTVETVNAGLDIEMPGPPRDRGEKLVAAVANGEVARETVRQRALNVLRLMQRTKAIADFGPWEESADNRPEHRALIRRAGAEGMVLLKNDGLLPLAAPAGKIAVIGPNARTAQIMGGGSAQLNPHYAISPLEGLANRVGANALVFADGCTNHRWEPICRGEIKAEFFANTDFEGAPVHTQTMAETQAFLVPPLADGKVDPEKFSVRLTWSFVPEHSGVHRFGIYSAGLSQFFVNDVLVADAKTDWTRGGTFFEEGCDEVIGEMDLEAGRRYALKIEFASKARERQLMSGYRAGIGLPLGDADIADAVAAARDAETAIVFVGRSGEWDTEGMDLPDIRLPGRQDELVSAVLDANPRTVVVLQTGGPVEMPWIDKAPAVIEAWYPGQEAGNAIADVLFGDAEPGGRLAQTFPSRWQDNPTYTKDPEIYPGTNGKVRYDEGVFIGYRHYEAKGITPLFPFGHGLSYTHFSLSDLTVAGQGEHVTASCTVTNTGARSGSTVVQLYVGDTEASEPRPQRELKDFAKVVLAPGESRTLSFELPGRAFAFFDVRSGCWRVEAGAFEISAGFSAADIRVTATIEMDAQTFDA